MLGNKFIKIGPGPVGEALRGQIKELGALLSSGQQGATRWERQAESAPPSPIQWSFTCFFIKKNFFLDLHLSLRERQNMSWGGTERKGDTESDAGSRLRAVSTEPDAGLELTDREIVT